MDVQNVAVCCLIYFVSFSGENEKERVLGNAFKLVLETTYRPTVFQVGSLIWGYHASLSTRRLRTKLVNNVLCNTFMFTDL